MGHGYLSFPGITPDVMTVLLGDLQSSGFTVTTDPRNGGYAIEGAGIKGDAMYNAGANLLIVSITNKPPFIFMSVIQSQIQAKIDEAQRKA